MRQKGACAETVRREGASCALGPLVVYLTIAEDVCHGGWEMGAEGLVGSSSRMSLKAP